MIRTNMETDVAEVEAEDSVGFPLDASLWTSTSAKHGQITVHPSGAAARSRVVVSVPAAFNVAVDLEEPCDVEVKGWLDGTVEVAVPEGTVSVGTVRGLMTRVHTGGGDVDVEHVEGNLDVRAGGDGAQVVLGKIMGEDVAVECAEGQLRCKALYAKRLRVAAGGMHASVLSTESGRLHLGGDVAGGGSSDLSSVDGDLTVRLPAAGNHALAVQAGGGLRGLVVAQEEEQETGAAASGTAVEVHLPEGSQACVRVRAAALDLDPRLVATDAEEAGLEAEGGGAEGTALRGEWRALLLGSEPTKDARRAARREEEAGSSRSEIRLDVPRQRVSIDQQSWFEQRLKAKTAEGGERPSRVTADAELKEARRKFDEHRGWRRREDPDWDPIRDGGCPGR